MILIMLAQMFLPLFTLSTTIALITVCRPSLVHLFTVLITLAQTFSMTIALITVCLPSLIHLSPILS
jgi:hypothetical protein